MYIHKEKHIFIYTYILKGLRPLPPTPLRLEDKVLDAWLLVVRWLLLYEYFLGACCLEVGGPWNSSWLEVGALEGVMLVPSWWVFGLAGTILPRRWGLGAMLAPSWRVWGPSWSSKLGVLGPSWLQVGGSWGHLDSKLRSLGDILAPNLEVLGPSGHQLRRVVCHMADMSKAC